MNSRIAVMLAALLSCITSLSAATYVVPNDRELIQRADDIVIATASSSHAELTARGTIVTRVDLRIDRVLKGERKAGDTLQLTELGGQVGERRLFIPDGVTYEDGESYLVFTESDVDGNPMTFGMGIGQFRVRQDLAGHRYFSRSEEGLFGWDADNLDAHVEHLRDAEKFADYIRGIVTQTGDPRGDYLIDAPQQLVMPKKLQSDAVHALAFTRASYLFAPTAYRWQTPTATFSTKGSAGTTPNGISAADAGLSAWTNDPNSNVNYTRGAQDDTGQGLFGNPDNKNTIEFGVGNPPIPSGVAGVGGISVGSGSYSLGGENFINIVEVDVAIAANQPINQQNCLNAVMTHEIGHTLGFRHSNQDGSSSNGPCPANYDCSGAAIMTSVTQCSYSSNLQPWDRNAVQTVYGTGPACTAPSITADPQGSTISSGSQATLSVTATGSTPLTYQWFNAAAGTQQNPVGTNSATLQVSPTSTTQYWVLVTNSCGTASSAAATVTVNASACTAPSINAQPQGSTISSGGQATLSVTATGSAPLSYQWYNASSGTQQNPVGTNSATLQISPTSTTQYWVLVTNSCGTATSSAATVTVNASACTAPQISAQPQSSVISPGGQATMFVNASGTAPLTYQWFNASSGIQQNPVGTNSPTLQVSPTVTSQYWVLVTNGCGSASSTTATVTVQGCIAPQVIVQPSDQTVVSGNTATLSLSSNNSNPTIVWYQGAPPDTSKPIGSGRVVTTGPITQKTTFYAVLSTFCGSATTRVVTVDVSASCTPPAVNTVTATPATITSGQSARLDVDATGTSLSYQWYEGQPGDTSKPVSGATTATVNVSPTSTTTYWVRVSSGCGAQPANSGAVVVTVGACAFPTVVSLTGTTTVATSGVAQLTVVATGGEPLKYQWYQGAAGDTSKPVGTDSPSFTSAALASDAKFWVRVSNACGSVDSQVITITVKPGRRRSVAH